jgi:hypothetical protein
LSLRFEIVDPNSPYDIFVRELVAMDGVDGSEIMLLDGEGCPTDQRIMAALNRASDDQKALVAHFDAFKFPTSEIVQFRALVTPCLPSCAPVICPVQDGSGLLQEVPSLGRRKRRMLNSTYEESPSNQVDVKGNPTSFIYSHMNYRNRRDLSTDKNEGLPQEEMLLVRSIHISDRFGPEKKRDRKLDSSSSSKFHDNSDKISRLASDDDEDDTEQRRPYEERTTESRPTSCINLSTVLGAGAVVVGIQIAMLIIGAMLFLRKKDISGKLQGVPRPQQTIFVKRY